MNYKIMQTTNDWGGSGRNNLVNLFQKLEIAPQIKKGVCASCYKPYPFSEMRMDEITQTIYCRDCFERSEASEEMWQEELRNEL